MALESIAGEDRITEVRIRGLRTLADVTLPLGGLTVLIGENGSGKSSILEALELLYKAAYLRDNQFVDALVRKHGGLDELLRGGSDALELGVCIEGRLGAVDYGFKLAKSANRTIVAAEKLDWWKQPELPSPLHVIERSTSGCKVFNQQANPKPGLQSIDVPAGALALTNLDALSANRAIERVRRVLEGASVHVPFELGALWVAREDGRQLPMRESAAPQSVAKLDRRGENIVNAYHQLSQAAPPEVWARVLERVEIGLDITDIRLPPISGRLELKVRFRGMTKEISASSLSDGQLAYLALVALAELAMLGAPPALLGFDEPEQHLHPGLLVRATWLLEELADRGFPVIVSTHSDRMLDALTEPAASAVLCELDEGRATRLLRPDAEALAKWLETYRGLGSLREENATHHVFTKTVHGSAAAGESR